MAVWRSVDLLDFKGELSYFRGHLVLTRDGDKVGELPLADLDLILVGLKTRLGGAVLQQLSHFDVALVPCGWNGVPTGAMYPWSKHGRTGARQLCQLTSSAPRQKQAWKQIIVSKVKGQAAVMREVCPESAERLRQLSAQVRSGDVGNIEAQAARLYWENLFEAGSFCRDSTSEDFINSALNYGYTILRGQCVRAVVAAGLTPGIGIWHRGRANPFSLADDLIEPFRPAVDHMVLHEANNAEVFDKSVRRRIATVTQQVLTKETGRSVGAEIGGLAQQLGLYFEKAVNSLAVPSWSGERSLADEGG